MRGDVPAEALAVDGVESAGVGDGDGVQRRRRCVASDASWEDARRPGRVNAPSHRSSRERRAIADDGDCGGDGSIR
jgi:hypothetical protein